MSEPGSCSPDDTLQTLLRYPLVPVYFNADATAARQVLAACYAGGLRAFEFTNRGPAAPAVFAALVAFARQSCPGLRLGIGTIYAASEAEHFIGAGADFVVQPCRTDEVAAVCRARAVPWVPGAMTLTEVYGARQAGAALVKLFPGNVLGPEFVRSLRGPLPQVPLMITGGVEPTAASLRAWLGAGANVLGLGSQLFKNAPAPAELSRQLTALLALATSLTQPD